jgi:TatD DNase family protein
LERILVETDCPFLSPQPRRGERNEPAFVRFTVEKLAEIRGMSFEEVAEATTANARNLFQL